MYTGLVLPKEKKIKETMNKNFSTTQMKHKFSTENLKETNLVINKLVKTLEKKTKMTRKGSVEYDMGYDIVEYIKKTKENICLLELCNIPQQIKKLLESFDMQPRSTSKSIESDTKIK